MKVKRKSDILFGYFKTILRSREKIVCGSFIILFPLKAITKIGDFRPDIYLRMNNIAI